MKDMIMIITSAMECIPSVCFEAWAAVHDFSPELIALSFRLFVCWFSLDQIVGIVAASDVDFEYVLLILMRNLVKFQVSGGRSFKMVLTGSGNWKSYCRYCITSGKI